MLQTFNFFLYLGATGFGGPLVLIQQMRHYYVDESKQISAIEFDQVFTLIKAMPGPIAFQMAVYLGHKFYKIIGALAAAIGLVLPSFTMMLFAGYFYTSFVNVSFVHPVLEGFLFSVSAVILISLKSLLVNNYKVITFIPLVLINMFLCWKQILPEPFLIIGFGLLTILIKQNENRAKLISAVFLLVDWSTVYELFKICLISGAVVFGTGLALIPALKTSFVDVNHWISLKEFADGVIFGQMSPGPVTITGSFLGYRIAGPIGAIAATVGIFLLPFIHMVTWFPHAVKWLSAQKWIHDFLLGATAAVVGSILLTIVMLNIESYNKVMFWILFLASFIILTLKPRIPVMPIVILSGLVNLLAFLQWHK